MSPANAQPPLPRRTLPTLRCRQMSAVLSTRFTRAFGLRAPIALAPMDLIAGGRLAAAVSMAGGLGLLGGGYGDPARVDASFAEAGNVPVGIGFITWSALKSPGLIDACLARRPTALMLSFGDGEGVAALARAQGVPVLWQVQTLDQARQALAAGVDGIVAQGQEGGGHGMDRGLMTLLPAIRDLAGPDQIVLGAGGIADGRGLAAVLALGGDGVLMGTRFMASVEAQAPQMAKDRMLSAGGDDTLRTRVFDVARGVDWPAQYSGRVLRNAFHQRWQGDLAALRAQADVARAEYEAAPAEDYATRVLIAGEALDLIHDLPTAAEIIARTTAQAIDLLTRNDRFQLEYPE